MPDLGGDSRIESAYKSIREIPRSKEDLDASFGDDIDHVLRSRAMLSHTNFRPRRGLAMTPPEEVQTSGRAETLHGGSWDA